MAPKSFRDPYSGATFRLGRRRPALRPAAPLLGAYLGASVSPPPTRDWRSPGALTVLSHMYLNDQLGDCVCAWGGHWEGLLTAGGTNPPDGAILAAYQAIGGYVPGDPATDQGCDEVTALDYWVKNGLPGGKVLAGWLRVDATDPVQVRAAINEFGSCTVGFEMPAAWVSGEEGLTPMTVWDVAGAPDPDNGHCVGLIGYDADRLILSTWGMTFYITNAALARYASTAGQGELYTGVSQDWIDAVSQTSPSGINWAQLSQDI